MRPSSFAFVTGALAVALSAVTPLFAEKASGTFTVAGKTTRFTEVYASREADPSVPGREYLVMLVVDTPVAPIDRTPAMLAAKAFAGALHAIRLRWTYGADELAVIPYHEGVKDSGRAFRGMATLDLRKLNEKEVDATFNSKALGQDWQFNATVKAVVVQGGSAMLEPDVELPAAPVERGGAAPAAGDATAIKRQLGAMRYEFTEDAFFQAIGDRNAAAVDLFLKAGMSPNAQNDQKRRAINHAVLMCGNDPAGASAVVIRLVEGKADLKSQDPDNKTTALVGSVQSCTLDAVQALIKAGSDLTARSAGGMTALQLADVFQRKDIADALRKAGAK